MSDIDTALKSLIGLQKSIDLLTKVPFESLLKQQERLVHNVYPKGFDETLRLVKQIAIEPYGQLQRQVAPQLTLTSGLLKQYKVITEPYQKIAEQLNISSLSFSAAIEAITVHKNYVSVPETLIPDDFQYEEVSDNLETSTEHYTDETSNIKKLSLSDALNIINMVVCILMTILAPFYNHVVDCVLSENENTETVAPITEEQAQQMLEYLSELIIYHQSIITAIEASEKSIQEHDSNSDNTQHHFATPGLVKTACEESCPTSADDHSNSE